MPSASALPEPATGLVGRASEIAAVADLLERGQIVTLTGPPGVGKTRLARAVVDTVRDRFGDGVAWADLTVAGDVAQVRAEVGRAMRADVSEALPDIDLLLVLDNCEHVLDAVWQLASQSTAVRLRVLATSRERLRVAAEQEFTVAPLPMPDPDEVGDLAALRRNHAMALLLARAPGGVTLTPRSARPLAEICVRLDGLPLALELAAARLRVFTPAELAFRLQDRGSALGSGPRDAPARHRDLRAAITWSHDLLPQRDRIVFRRLAAFPGGWTVADAEVVCALPDVLDALESLLEKNLVRRMDGDAPDARFTMLMSVREFAAEQLVAHGEEPDVRARHAAYFAALAREFEHTVGTDGENATWRVLATMRADLRAALDQCERSGADEDLLWVAVTLGWYCYTRGRLGEARRIVEVVDAHVDAVADPDVRSAARLVAGVLSFGLGELSAAAAALDAVEVLDRDGGERRFAIAEAFLGHVARDRGDASEAARRYFRARGIYEGLNNRRGVAWANHDLGLLDLDAQHWSEAETLLRDAVARFEQLDYDWAAAVSTVALGRTLLRAGALDDAAAALSRGRTLHEQVDDRRGSAQCLEAIAELALAQGRAASAARLMGSARAERDRGAMAAPEPESARLAALDAELTRVLGVSAADHERRAGRALPTSGVRELAATVTEGARTSGVELTPRQWEVATLVADGSTNRQIATALGISEKTAEVHVHNIMDRLGTPSRAAVAAWVVRRTP